MAHSQYQDRLSEQVAKKEQRKIRARRDRDRSIWYGLGMFGLIGWSIALPTILAVAIGIWLDRGGRHKYSFTLICLFVGVVIGCWIAWYWVKRETWEAEDLPNGRPPDKPDEHQGSSA